MAKKALPSLLACLLAAGCLAGCQEKPGDASQSAAASQGASAADSAGADTSGSGSGSGELITLSVMGPDTTKTDNNTLSNWVANGNQLMDRLTSDLAGYGVAIAYDLIPNDQYPTVCQTQIAAGISNDYMCVDPLDNQTLLNMVEQGKILSVEEIIAEHSQGPAKDFYLEESGTGNFSIKLNRLSDGKAYWLTTMTVAEYNGVPTGMSLTFQIRQDWLDKLELPTPATLDELYDTLVAFQERDANGNGEKDEVANIPTDSFGNDIAQWFGLGTDVTYVVDSTGKITSPWYEPHVKEYFQYMKRLNDAGLLETSGQATEKNVENRISAIANWSGETWIEPPIVIPDGAEPAEYVPVIIPAVDGMEPLIRMQRGSQNNDSQKYIITSACKNPEAAARMIDYFTTEEFNVLSQWGIEGLTFEVKDGVRSKIDGGSPEADFMKSAAVALWSSNSVFPRFETGRSRAEELQSVADQGLARKAAAAEKTLTYAHTTPFSPNADYAVPTLEEIEAINRITTDLTTYSSELHTKLILGHSTLDDWDAYMDDLKRLGLDELITINQARYDRAQ